MTVPNAKSGIEEEVDDEDDDEDDEDEVLVEGLMGMMIATVS